MQLNHVRTAPRDQPVARLVAPPVARLVACLTVGVLAVTGCDGMSSLQGDADPAPTVSASPTPTVRSTEPMPSAPEGLARFYRQDVTWQPCSDGFECTTVEVPLDYADPRGDTVGLAVSRRPADEPDARIGALLVNPGGPGVSGISYAPTAAAQFRSDVLDRYDIVGFDPRGVSASEGIDCLSDAELDDFVALDPTHDDSAAVAAAKRELTAFGRGCVQGSGGLAAHMSTPEAVRDMDIIRAVLGSPKLNFYGASYGTLLGATYADLFPERVGAMVLDGAVDPAVSFVRGSLRQAEAFELAVQSYLEYCVEQGSCPLGDSVPAAERGLRDLLAAIDDEPLPALGGRRLTNGSAVLGVWLPLYVPSLWPTLSVALADALGGDGSTLMRLADVYVSRGADGYQNNSIEALYAVNCLDQPASRTAEQIRELLPRFREASPVFGEVFAWGLLGCADWPVQAAQEIPRIDAPGAPPIVVIGTTDDPATPYRSAVALAEQLRSGRLVTRVGDGHTGFSMGSDCVDNAVNDFFANGAVPEDGLRCS